MFRFNTTGTVSGFKTSRDGSTVYVDLVCDKIDGFKPDSKDEEIGKLNVAIPAGQWTTAVRGASRVEVSGVGFVAERVWHNNEKNTDKIIANHRYRASTVKPLA